MTVLDAIIRDDSDRIVMLYFSGAPQKLMHLNRRTGIIAEHIH
ncbi:hypothetical protein NIES3804_37770 [Microcystis aeruginosa NIES-3804]|uniref:Uncharacterized protein n=1 Tax=Microcystis aeruginosa NIES-3804 TaxID=2517783 RepID=A0A6H9GQC3_MICAE|nr:hypothetical protein NIES3804_37770 [Microcystis aeruginosa NIES-3804]